MISAAEVYFKEKLLECAAPVPPLIKYIDEIAPRSQFARLIQVDELQVLFELLKLQDASAESPKISLFKYNLNHEEFSRYSAFLALFTQFIQENEMLSVRVLQKGTQMVTAASCFFKAARPDLWIQPKILLKVGDKWIAGAESLLFCARSYWFQVGYSVLAVGGDCGEVVDGAV